MIHYRDYKIKPFQKEYLKSDYQDKLLQLMSNIYTLDDIQEKIDWEFKSKLSHLTKRAIRSQLILNNIKLMNRDYKSINYYEPVKYVLDDFEEEEKGSHSFKPIQPLSNKQVNNKRVQNLFLSAQNDLSGNGEVIASDTKVNDRFWVSHMFPNHSKAMYMYKNIDTYLGDSFDFVLFGTDDVLIFSDGYVQHVGLRYSYSNIEESPEVKEVREKTIIFKLKENKQNGKTFYTLSSDADSPFKMAKIKFFDEQQIKNFTLFAESTKKYNIKIVNKTKIKNEKVSFKTNKKSNKKRKKGE